MIKIADDSFSVEGYINLLAFGNPFGCRIKSLYKTYDYNLPFVDFWVQLDGGKCVSLIARLEASFILCLTETTDFEELNAFMRVSGALSVICDGKYTLQCGLNPTKGPILHSKSAMQNESDFEVVTPSVKEVYGVISKSSSKNFTVPSYESFALDVAHRLSKGTARVYGVQENGSLAACIMTLCESSDSAVLGALATAPDYRRRGYGAFLIKYINNKLTGEGKQVFLHRAPDENIEFYSKLGFSSYGTWAEYS